MPQGLQALLQGPRLVALPVLSSENGDLHALVPEKQGRPVHGVPSLWVGRIIQNLHEELLPRPLQFARPADDLAAQELGAQRRCRLATAGQSGSGSDPRMISAPPVARMISRPEGEPYGWTKISAPAQREGRARMIIATELYYMF